MSAGESPAGLLPNPYTAKLLPNPYPNATVAQSAPVRFTEEQAKAQQEKFAFIQPIKVNRPQAKGAANTKNTVAKAPTSTASQAPMAATDTAPEQKLGIDYWRSTADDDAAALEWRREEDRRNRDKAKQAKKLAKQYGWWKGDAAYRADKPSNLRAYRASGHYATKLDDFASFIKRSVAARQSETRSEQQPSISTSPEPATVAPEATLPPPPPPPMDEAPEPVSAAPPPPPPAAASAPSNPTISAPPVPFDPKSSSIQNRFAHATIAAPPVRYNVPKSQAEAAQEEAQEERPAKRTKLTKLSVAEKMMANMGYKKGQGLGKNSDGITTHLEVEARKVEKKIAERQFDDDFAGTGTVIKGQQIYDIRGGFVPKPKEPTMFGVESKVVVAWGCVDGIDWDEDAQRNDGGVRQEIGQTFDDKFGRVERVHVDLNNPAHPVYIKFASELSALNAVNRFHEGYQFRGRRIKARYFDAALFQTHILGL